MNPFPKLLEGSLIDTKHVESAAIFVAKTGDATAASNFTVSLLQLRAFQQTNVSFKVLLIIFVYNRHVNLGESV